MPASKTAVKSRFCSACGTQLNADARFCHNCGSRVGESAAGQTAETQATGGVSKALRWGVPSLAFVALIVLSIVQFSAPADPAASAEAQPLATGAMQAPDISSMSPEERADRLFNQVMRLSSEGKADSAAFFAPMALFSIEALVPLNAHRRYDIALVALVTGNVSKATAQSDTILAERPTHLLGLALAARAADASGKAAAMRSFQERLLAAEQAELALGLPEYKDHNADILEAVRVARNR